MPPSLSYNNTITNSDKTSTTTCVVHVFSIHVYFPHVYMHVGLYSLNACSPTIIIETTFI